MINLGAVGVVFSTTIVVSSGWNFQFSSQTYPHGELNVLLAACLLRRIIIIAIVIILLLSHGLEKSVKTGSKGVKEGLKRKIVYEFFFPLHNPEPFCASSRFHKLRKKGFVLTYKTGYKSKS